jgi:hypothetical protein
VADSRRRCNSRESNHGTKGFADLGARASYVGLSLAACQRVRDVGETLGPREIWAEVAACTRQLNRSFIQLQAQRRCYDFILITSYGANLRTIPLTAIMSAYCSMPTLVSPAAFCAQRSASIVTYEWLSKTN